MFPARRHGLTLQPLRRWEKFPLPPGVGKLLVVADTLNAHNLHPSTDFNQTRTRYTIKLTEVNPSTSMLKRF